MIQEYATNSNVPVAWVQTRLKAGMTLPPEPSPVA
jgi:hypothetical protein